MTNLELFVSAYIECMLWSSSGTDQHGNDLEHFEGVELSGPGRDAVIKDCESFVLCFGYLLEAANEKQPGYCYHDAGHDFWLTRNGHGAGFWDRGLGSIGEELTTAAEGYKEKSAYIGDDGMVYL